jgi:inosine-uridine nucleoside N-ribohydrolase
VLAAGLSLDLVPLDATHQAVLPRADLDAALRRRPGPVAQRIAAVTDYALRVDHERGSAGMPCTIRSRWPRRSIHR